MPDYVHYQGCVSIYADHFRYADLSVQTGAGERIGDLRLAAKVARKSTAKITCPTSGWRIENRLQRQSAFFRHLMSAPQHWRLALLRRLPWHSNRQVNE